MFKTRSFVIDWELAATFKEKDDLKQVIIENGGEVSYSITKQTTCLVIAGKNHTPDSYKVKQADNCNIPVVTVSYLLDSIKRGALQDITPYLTRKMKTAPDKDQGQGTSNEEDTSKSADIAEFWDHGGDGSAEFDESNYAVVKFCFLRKSLKTDCQLFNIIELHECQSNSSPQSSKFRVHSIGEIKDDHAWSGKRTVTKRRYFSTLTEAVRGYAWLISKLTTPPYLYHQQRKPPPLLICSSEKLREMLNQRHSVIEDVDVIKDLWKETWLYIREHISAEPQKLSLEMIEKAIGILELLKEELRNGGDKAQIEFLSESFYQTLPHTPAHQVTVNSLDILIKKQDFCEFARRVLSLSESVSEDVDPHDLCLSVKWRLHPLNTHGSQYQWLVSALQSRLPAIREVKKVYIVEKVCDRVEDVNRGEAVGTFYPVNPHAILHVLCSDLSGPALSSGLCANRKGVQWNPNESFPEGCWEKGSVRNSHFVFICKDEAKNKEQRTLYLVELSLFDGSLATQIFLKDLRQPASLSDSAFTDQPLLDRNYYCQTVGDSFEPSEKQIKRIGTREISIFTNAHQSLQRVGLTRRGDNSYHVSAVSIGVQAKVMDMIAEVILVQTYRNTSNENIEAQYNFPLDDRCAVTGFEAIVNDCRIYGKIEEKEAADQIYTDALDQGHQAGLLEQSTTNQDMFTMKVGNLRPQDTAVVKVKYICELTLQGDHVSFCLPPLEADYDQKIVCDVQMCECTVDVAVEMPFDISTVECVTHEVKMERTATKATIQMNKNQRLTKSFQLLIGFAEVHLPRMWVERHSENPWHQACMVTFYPEHTAVNQKDREVIFLLDLSESMNGKSLEDAKTLISEAVGSLKYSPCKFNIMSFGHELQELFPSCVSPSEENLDVAISLVTKLETTGRCTDLCGPLSALNKLLPSDVCTAVFIVTDGLVPGQTEVLEAAKKTGDHIQIFTLGVGPKVNSQFLSMLAREGGGLFEMFDSKERHSWEKKMSRLLGVAGHPCLTDLTITWQQFESDMPTPEQSPAILPNLFSGSRCVVYGFIQNCTLAYLNGRQNGEEVSIVVSTPDLCVTEGTILHSLTAHGLIRDWQNGTLHNDRVLHEALKFSRRDRILQMSKEFNVLCPLTSFVAVEERTVRESEKVDEQSESDNAPVVESFDSSQYDKLSLSGKQCSQSPFAGFPAVPHGGNISIPNNKSSFWSHAGNFTNTLFARNTGNMTKGLNGSGTGNTCMPGFSFGNRSGNTLATSFGSNSGFLPNSFKSNAGHLKKSEVDHQSQGVFGGSNQQAPQGLFGSKVELRSQGLFGSKVEQPSQGLFGSKVEQSSQGLFGSKVEQPSQGLFGSKVEQPSQGLFGSKVEQPSQGLFGSKVEQSSQGLFGSNVEQPSQGLFGSKVEQSSQGLLGSKVEQPSKGLFGSKVEQPSQGLFGSKVEQPSQGVFGSKVEQPSQGLFGSKVEQPSQGLFGSKVEQPSQGLFGSKVEQSSQGLFGSNVEQPSQGLFGSKVEQSSQGLLGSKVEQPSKGLFGSKVEQPSQGLFGSKVEQPSQGVFGSKVEQPSQGLFGSKVEQPSQGLFGSKVEQPSQGLFGSKVEQPSQGSFGNKVDQPSQSVFGSKTGRASQSVFGLKGEKPSQSLFGSKAEEQASLGSKCEQPSQASFVSTSKQPSQTSFGSKAEQSSQASFGSKVEQPSQASFGSKVEQPSQASFGSKVEQPSQASFGSKGEQPSQASFGSKDEQPSQASFGNKVEQPSQASFGSKAEQPSQAFFGSKAEQPSKASFGSKAEQPSQAFFGSKAEQPSKASFGSKAEQPSQVSFGSKAEQPSKASFEQPSTSSVSNPSFGSNAQGSNSAFGSNIQGNVFGSASGSNVQGGGFGSAFGNDVQGRSIGFAFGSNARGGDFGSAFGSNAHQSGFGSAFGSNGQGSGFGSAFGNNIQESGFGPAFGNSIQGSGFGSTFGSNVQRSNFGSAFGSNAQGNEVGSAFGGNVQGSGFGSAFGSNAQGSGFGSAFGGNVQGSGFGSTFGSNVQGSGFGSAFGGNVQGSGFGSAFGSNAQGSGFGSAFGGNVQGSGFGSTFGSNVQGSGFGSAFGGNVQGSGFGSAFGGNVQGSGFGSAFGSNAQGIGFGGSVSQGTMFGHGIGNTSGCIAASSNLHPCAMGQSFGFANRTPQTHFGQKGAGYVPQKAFEPKARTQKPFIKPAKLNLPPEWSQHRDRYNHANTLKSSVRPRNGEQKPLHRSNLKRRTAEAESPVRPTGQVLRRAQNFASHMDKSMRSSEQGKSRNLTELVEEQWDYTNLVEYLKVFGSMLSGASSCTGFHLVQDDLISLSEKTAKTRTLLEARHSLDMEGRQLQSLREFVRHKWSVRDSSRLLEVIDDIGDLIDTSDWPPSNAGQPEICKQKHSRARCGKLTLCENNLHDLFTLQKALGQWEFNKKLDLLIGVDEDLCINLLNKAGLKSLGKIVSEKVLAVMATMMVLLTLLELLTPLSFPRSRSEFLEEISLNTTLEQLGSALKGHQGGQEFAESIHHAGEFVKRVDRDHILLYSQLELGASWEEAAGNMLGFISKG